MDYPKHLFRFFKNKEHRDQFIQGLIRFGRLEVYKEIEDEKRKDNDEGEPRGKYKTDKQIFLNISNKTGKVIGSGLQSGVVNISGYSPNSFFIVSMSDDSADLELLSNKFGKYAVKISNVGKLLDSINQNCNVSWKVGKIILEQVKYDKDMHITMEKNNPHLPFGYYFAQKSETFAHESEWRIVLTGSGIDETDEKFVVIEVGSLNETVSKLDF